MNVPTSTEPLELPIAALKAELFRALAHPIRVRALELLVDGPRTVGELAAAVGAELSHVSQQLGVLRRSGVVTTRRSGSTIHYSVRDPRMAELLAVARAILVAGLQESRQMLDELEQGEGGAAPAVAE